MSQCVVNSEMISLARESRGVTQAELCRRTDLKQSRISRYESGTSPVPDDDVRIIARALDYPETFFYQEDHRSGSGTLSAYRRRQSISAQKLNQIEAQNDIYKIHLRRLLRNVEMDYKYGFFEMDIEDFDGGPSEIAFKLREKWDVPSGPIRNLVELIERAGGIVIQRDFGTRKIDAVSQWPPDLPPLFFINPEAPGERARFTLAHELGHTVMHRAPTNNEEIEADQFASEFLMPAVEIAPQLCDLTIHKLGLLKRHWRVSMAALIRRAKDLQVITPMQYRNWFKHLSRKGFRKVEPNPISPENPIALSKIIGVYRSHYRFSADKMGRMLAIHPEHFRRQYEYDQLPTEIQANRPRLRIV